MNAPAEVGAPVLSKAERTRAAIVDAALMLFAERGFDATTMRDIAGEAGVSVGNAYYYFASKEELVLAIYERFSQATIPPIEAAITGHDVLAERIELAMLSWLRTMKPYRPFASVMFRNVADPGSTMSPLSEGSSVARNESFELWRNVLRGATDVHVAPELEDALVKVLWGFSMAMVIAWTQDPTADGRRVKKLVRRCAPLVARLVGFASVPALAPLVDEVRGVLDDVLALRD